MEQGGSKDLFKWLFYTGLFTGTLDILSAFIIAYKAGPAIILRSIASGVFGMQAFTAGAQVIFLGLLLHYLIAFIWSSLFFMVYNRLLQVLKFRFAIVLVIGLVIWAVMGFVVVPLSNAPGSHYTIIGQL